jgi:hypothetical protein
MNKATMIQHSKDMIEEFNNLIKTQEEKKLYMLKEFNYNFPKYDIHNENNNDKESVLLFLGTERLIHKIDKTIWKMNTAIQKIENLLITLEELK